MSERLTFAQLADWIDGRLSPTEAADVAARVAGADDEVQATVAWLQQFRALRRRLLLADAPPELHATLQDLFDDYAARAQADPFRRFVATLTFDSAAETAVAGVRSPLLSDERQLIYSSDTADIVLTLRHAPGPDQHLSLAGQIFPTGQDVPDIVTVQLLQQQQEQAITTSNDLGEFAFDAFSPGKYDIICSSDTLEITLPSVELRT